MTRVITWCAGFGAFSLCAIALLLPVELHAQAAAASAPTTELAVLRAQLETTRQFQDSFISMGQWVLASAVGVAFAIAAFSWSSNRIAYERERDFLRQEAQTMRDQIATTIENEVLAVAERLEKTIASKQLDIQEAVEKALKSKFSSLESKISAVNERVLDLLADSMEREAIESLAKQSYAWALYKYCELLDLIVERKTDHYEAGDVLDEIRKIVELPQFEPDADSVSKLTEALKRLPTRYHAVAETLTAKVKTRLA